MPHARLAAPLALLLACGPQAPMTTDGGTGDGATVTPAESAGTTGPGLTTTTALTSTGQEPTTDGIGFIVPSDAPCDGVFAEPRYYCSPYCDVWVQDCPPGEKCSPYADDGGDAWNSLRCVPLAPDPGQPGEPCTVEGSPVTGRDTCDVHAMCFYIDPDTLTGTCVPFCKGSPDDIKCPQGSSCLIANEGDVPVCLPTCDPLAASCPEGQVCAPSPFDPGAFFCLPDASGDQGQAFDDCDALATCDPGLLCAPAELADACAPEAAACCLPFCDLNAPACPGMTLQCQPYFEQDQAPAGLEHLGLCRLPG